MSGEEHKKSTGVSKLETRKAMEAKCQKEVRGKRKLVMKQDSGDSQDLNKGLGRKRKTRPAHDLKDSKAECKVQEVPLSGRFCLHVSQLFWP